MALFNWLFVIAFVFTIDQLHSIHRRIMVHNKAVYIERTLRQLEFVYRRPDRDRLSMGGYEMGYADQQYMIDMWPHANESVLSFVQDDAGDLWVKWTLKKIPFVAQEQEEEHCAGQTLYRHNK
jgi:hypothetical protein